MAEVTQSEIAQKQKLQTVLERINEVLKVSTRNTKWNVDSKLVAMFYTKVEMMVVAQCAQN